MREKIAEIQRLADRAYCDYIDICKRELMGVEAYVKEGKFEKIMQIIKSTEKTYTMYGRYLGLLECREALATKLKADYCKCNIFFEPGKSVLVEKVNPPICANCHKEIKQLSAECTCGATATEHCPVHSAEEKEPHHFANIGKPIEELKELEVFWDFEGKTGRNTVTVEDYNKLVRAIKQINGGRD